MPRYDLTIIHALEADTDEHAKQQAATLLRAIALLGAEHLVHYTKVGIQLLDPDHNEVDLPTPQFPRGRKVDEKDI